MLLDEGPCVPIHRVWNLGILEAWNIKIIET